MSTFGYIARAYALLVLMEKFTISQEPGKQIPAFVYKNLHMLPQELKKIYENKNVEEDKQEYFFATVPELIIKYGYPVEQHTVLSSDGYITTLHRIPHGRNGSVNKTKRVVLLEHGLFLSSGVWVLAGPDKGLGFILADEGFDVWMANGRGNIYSKSHSNLDVNSAEYWQFSWHEMGVYDATATIDYILENTNQEKIFHVGYSQGTTVFYVMCTERPEYNEKIIAHFSLGPIAYTTNLVNPLAKVFSFAEGTIEFFSRLLGIHEIFRSSTLSPLVGHYLCSDDALLQRVCISLMVTCGGFSAGQINSTLIPQFMNYFAAGASIRQLMHYVQGINSGQFRQWDFGTTENLLKYCTPTPPEYNLTKISAPVYVYYSQNDWMSSGIDAYRLYTELGNAKGLYLNPDEGFNHMDYIGGKTVRGLIYDGMITTMKEYQQPEI